MQQLPLGVRLHDQATFDSWYAGPNHRVLACLRAAAAGTLGLPSVFLSGRAGAGKSHLLQAVCGTAAGGGLRSGYLALDQVLAAGGGEEALEGWAALSVVCVDGVDAVAGDRGWETALMRLYNALRERGGILVAAARSPAAELDWVLPDLRSRLQSGMLLGLVPLDDEAVSRALQLRAHARGMTLPEETAAWLLRRFRRDMHSLCSLLDSLDEASLARHRRLTIPFVRDAIFSADRHSGPDAATPTEP